MKQSSSEHAPARAGEPAAQSASTTGPIQASQGSPLESRIESSPRMMAQRQQLRAMTDAPIQRMQTYPPSVLAGVRVAPDFTSTKVGPYTVPKRMLARPLALPNGPYTGKRETENTPLWKKLKSEQESAAFKDGHLLNHKLGGPADARNMVPISADANAQMIPFDAHVEALMTKGVVVDLEVSANYGRNDGLTTAQNAIPTSLDMRMIPQGLGDQGWVDDPDEHVVVQNVKINLESDSDQAKKAKRKSQEYGKRDEAWAKFGFLANAGPQETQEGPEQPNDQLARKNEEERQERYLPFTSMPEWTGWKEYQRQKGRDKGARDIVSGNLVDAAWIGADRSESDEVVMDDFDQQSYQMDALLDPSTDWMVKATIVKGNPGLIDRLRHFGWTEAADLMAQYLTLDLSKFRVATQ